MVQSTPPEDESEQAPKHTISPKDGNPSKKQFGQSGDHNDGRKKWEWESKYPSKAWSEIKFESLVLLTLVLILILIAGLFMGLTGEKVDFRLLQKTDLSGEPVLTIQFSLLATFLVGSAGATTFSIKWLIHSVAKGNWHLDRRPWRFFVPIIGGVYACVVMALYDAGLFAGRGVDENAADGSVLFAMAFLIGYFSDGVSGLLSNIANAVFGTVDKK